MCQFPQCAKKKSADRRDRNRGSQEGNLRRRRLKDGMMKEKKECKKKETDRLLLVRGIGSFKAPSNELCTQKEINTADDWGDVDYCLRTIGHQSVSSSYNAQSRDAWATLDDGISRKKKKEEKRKERKGKKKKKRGEKNRERLHGRTVRCSRRCCGRRLARFPFITSAAAIQAQQYSRNSYSYNSSYTVSNVHQRSKCNFN